MAAPEEVYVLMHQPKITEPGAPIVARTTLQGAAAEMVSYTAEEQRQMWVVPVRLVDDHND